MEALHNSLIDSSSLAISKSAMTSIHPFNIYIYFGYCARFLENYITETIISRSKKLNLFLEKSISSSYPGTECAPLKRQYVHNQLIDFVFSNANKIIMKVINSIKIREKKTVKNKTK